MAVVETVWDRIEEERKKLLWNTWLEEREDWWLNSPLDPRLSSLALKKKSSAVREIQEKMNRILKLLKKLKKEEAAKAFQKAGFMVCGNGGLLKVNKAILYIGPETAYFRVFSIDHTGLKLAFLATPKEMRGSLREVSLKTLTEISQKLGKLESELRKIIQEKESLVY